MGKLLCKRGLTGFAVGIALNEAVALAASWALHLGYYMPCLASLPERVGGEINAVVLQMLLFGLLGAGVSVAWTLLRRRAARG